MLLEISPFIQSLISGFAGVFIVMAQIILLFGVYTKKFNPSLLSWFGWAILMGTSLVAQIQVNGWVWNLFGLLLSTVGCLFIFLLAFFLKNYQLKKTDWYFLVISLCCLVIYIYSKDAWVTTIFAILADLIVGIPTLQLAIKNPQTQKSVAWLFGFISWCLTLIVCIGHSWLYALFPIYLFLYNGLLVYFTRNTKPKESTIGRAF